LLLVPVLENLLPWLVLSPIGARQCHDDLVVALVPTFPCRLAAGLRKWRSDGEPMSNESPLVSTDSARITGYAEVISVNGPHDYFGLADRPVSGRREARLAVLIRTTC
jgi:hypothetical protein